MIGVIDYGAGNLRSVANALDRLGFEYEVCDRPEAVVAADRVILPGVGHFGAAARSLASTGIDRALRVTAGDGVPVLGICLGMQLLLESSDEAEGVPGLGILPGRNVRLQARRVPHMGWNRVRWPYWEEYYYFAHGFAARTTPVHVVATVDVEGETVPAAIGRGKVLGVQFHPEKSGDRGLGLLEEFCRC